MSKPNIKRGAGIALAAILAASVSTVAVQAAQKPIVIGVTAEMATIPGKAIANGATLAVQQINAAGGINGRPIKLIIEDNHVSTTDAIRSFQRMTRQDHAVAILGAFTSEVALALEPWSARLHEPFLITGAASNKLAEYVHADYAQRKYIFHAYLPAAYLAQAVCDSTKDLLVPMHMTTAVVLSEDAAWTKPLDAGYDKCLPKVGVKVLDNIRFDPNTTDFTPIYQKIEAMHPAMIMAGWAHVGVQPTVQWAEQKVPVALVGINAQAGSSLFWKATHGATEGVLTGNTSAPGVAITPKTIPFTNAYSKEFGSEPAYSAYSTYDAMYALADAIKREKSTKPNAIVAGLEKTDMVGTQGRLEFQGKAAKFTHALRYGPGYITGVAIQWQNGVQKCVWPLKLANAKVVFPSFVTATK